MTTKGEFVITNLFVSNRGGSSSREGISGEISDVSKYPGFVEEHVMREHD